MKYDITQPLVSYKGEPIRMDVKPDAPVATLGGVLEFLLANASDDKHKIYKLLRKVSEAKPILEIDAGDVTVLKKLAEVLPVVAYGSVIDALESPSTKATVIDVRRDGPIAEISPRD